MTICSTQLVITLPDGVVVEFGAGRTEVRHVASEASREGVEGEPEATLGGDGGSPLGASWCRHCGQSAFDQMQCIKCWNAGFEFGAQMIATGYATKEFADALAPVIGAALRTGQLLDRASQQAAQTLEQFGSTLKRLAG
jgi:hypothetical protein